MDREVSYQKNTHTVLGTSKKKTGSYLGVSKNRGTPKWMVYIGKPYSNG